MPEFLVILPDFSTPETLQKRLSVRAKHFEGLKDGSITFGGAMLESHAPNEDGTLKMKGSALTMEAESEEKVWERLRADVYAEGQVWDLSKVQVIPFKTGIRKAL